MILALTKKSCIQDFIHHKRIKFLKCDLDNVEIYYGITRDLDSEYYWLKNYITEEEQLRADKFYFEEDKKTFITCHALLRIILSIKLKINPLEISFVNSNSNKPELKDNSTYFNITHTRDAFAFAINQDFYVGIDLEKVDQQFDFTSIVKFYFNYEERDYILESKDNASDRFYLLWTQKEALFKAIGSGILANLKDMIVLQSEYNKSTKVVETIMKDSLNKKHIIYSKKLLDYYLSIAVPSIADITLL